MTQFYFPPRPEKAILPSLIKHWEDKGWIAQIKKNGTCSCAAVDDHGNVTFFTRHGDKHKAWTPTEEAHDFFGRYPDSYFVFELLHSKGGSVRDTVYLFDLLRMEGTDQVGFPLRERLCLLNTLPVSGKISVARTYTKDLTALYRGLPSSLDEGIVLKDPEAVLAECHRDGLNANWQVKCRRATKNYQF